MEDTEKNLSYISTGAGFLSWLLLLLYLAISFTRIADLVKSPIAFDYTLYANLLNLLNPLFLAGFYFLVLQAISHGITYFLDRYEADDDDEEDDEEDEEATSAESPAI